MTQRLTLLAASFALAAAPALTTLAQQQNPQLGQQQPGQQQPGQQQPGQQQPGQQQPGQPGQQQPGQPIGEQPMNDQLFVMAAAEAGMGEIGMSQLAKQKTEDQQVQQYADQMIRDHTQANQQLMQLAEAKGIQVPQRPGLKDTATAMALSGCSPEQFPQEFFKQQEAAHVLAVGLFKAEAERGQDPEIRDFAQTTLARLEQHLNLARQHAGGGQGQGLPQPGESSQSGRGATDQDLIDALGSPSGDTP
jgi:putative membrane protein